ncbi:MAG: DUF1318 domain-containing protein [Candidatus Abyssobacteria bacterium SURF_5]|uniref:DUF1318 domain-containing protein n=1 Tax=Abyssobacteria bacterium (strain SURF_5) TaxID=2093360 RepID=A0A3A4NUW1_ABYX5|nr:MAG: DUF1318 domain-containing protein [Candidatus Abyssubacteria bacterium SURF_5]
MRINVIASRQEKEMAYLKIKFVMLLFPFVSLTSCANGLFAQTDAQIPEEQIALVAGQIEEAVLYIDSAKPAAVTDYQINEDTGEVVGEFKPIELLIGDEEIRQKVPALAQLHADTEVMLSAIRGRILRRPAVYEFQQRGCLGEGRRGYLENMKAKSCSGGGRERDRISYIILLENRDRRSIYKEFIEALHLRDSSLVGIEEIFAEQIRRKAWAGTPLEAAAGGWERK